MAYKELEDFLDSDLTLPIRGKKYTCPDPGWENVLWLEQRMKTVMKAAQGADLSNDDREVLNDADTDELFATALGDAYETMLDDGLPAAYIRHAGLTAVMHWSVGEEQARAFWESGGDPERLAASGNRAHRRAAQSTQRQESRSGTNRRRRRGRPSGKSSDSGTSSNSASMNTSE
ncbi:DUF7426 family protein [Nocardiopsis alba]|uniref:DUF7426 family protein n=1 Tax=Nocardiopsis alba TaxID=53437 RepID=UPI0035DB5F43